MMYECLDCKLRFEIDKDYLKRNKIKNAKKLCCPFCQSEVFEIIE